MGYQDFLRRIKDQRQSEPIALPDYELPTQIETAEPVKAAKSVAPKKRKTLGPLDRQLPEGAPFETYQDVKDWNPDAPIQDLKQLGSALKLRRQLHEAPKAQRRVQNQPAKAIPYSSQIPETTKQPELLEKMDFRGPSEADKMIERSTVAAGLEKPKRKSRANLYERILDDQTVQARARSPRGIQERLEGIDNGETSITLPQSVQSRLEGVDTGETKFEQSDLDKAKAAQSRKDFGRTVTKMLNPAAMFYDELAKQTGITLPQEAFENFGSTVLKTASGIPEGFVRMADRMLNTGTLAQAENIRNMINMHPEWSQEQRAEAENMIQQLHGELYSMGDVAENITNAGKTAADFLYPADPNAEESINPLKRSFYAKTMPKAAASMAPFLGAAAVGGGLGIAPEIVAGVTGAAMEVPDRYHEARDAGATPEQLARGVDVSMVAGGVESLGAGSLLGKVGLTGKSLGGHFAKEGVQEFGQEGVQSVIGGVGDKYYSQTKPDLTAGQITMEALHSAVPALFLGFGGAAMGVPHHLAEKRAGQNLPPEQLQAVAGQLQELATTQPDHPVIQTLTQIGIDPTTIGAADDRALDALSTRLQAMASMDSKIAALAEERQVAAQQVQLATDAQRMGRVPSQVDQMAIQGLPVVEQQLAEAQMEQQAIVQDLQATVSPLFKSLAKAAGIKQIEPIADIADDPKGDLLKEVRKAGGLSASPGAIEAGELERLSVKESGAGGLISRKAGEKPDTMREMMASEGLTNAETPQAFIEDVERAAIEKQKPKSELESYESYARGQMSEQELADSDNLDSLLADKTHAFTQIYRTLDNPKNISTKELRRKFVEEADKAGFSDEFIDRSLAEFQSMRGVNNAESVDRSVDDDNFVGSHQVGNAASLSPYKDIEANNKDLLKRLYDTNLNSNEGKAGIAELRKFATTRGIKQKHVDAHISDIYNWQKRYGVPPNPDVQVAESKAIEKPATMPQTAPKLQKLGFNNDQRKLLGRIPADIHDSEFDQYRQQIEELQSLAVRGAEHGGINITPGEEQGLISKLKEIRAERKRRVKAGQLPALDESRNVPKFDKKKLGQQMVEQDRARKAAEAAKNQRETESVPRETENVPQAEVFSVKATGVQFSRGEGPFIGYASGNEGGRLAVEAHGETAAEAEANAKARYEREWKERENDRASETANNRQDKKTVGKLADEEIPTVSVKEIDLAAHEAATSPTNDLPEPTESQKEAGNYKKGHISLHGLDITIENPKGSTRSGKDANGKPWEVEMTAHYGYIRRTVGADEEQVDVYVGDQPSSDKVYVVDQIDPKTGKFDEHKVILGVKTKAVAEALYDDHFSDKSGPKRRGNVIPLTMDEFKNWLKTEDNTLPAGETVSLEEKSENTSNQERNGDTDFQVGEYVTFSEPVVQYKSGKPFQSSKKVRGKILEIKPDGSLYLRRQDGGYTTKTRSEVSAETANVPLAETKTAKPEVEVSELRPLPKIGDVKNVHNTPHTLERIQRIGELDFELWQSNEDSGMTMITRDAETGDALPGSIISDTWADRAKRRFLKKTEEARFGSKENAASQPKTKGEVIGSDVAQSTESALGKLGDGSDVGSVDAGKLGGNDERSIDSGRSEKSESGPDGSGSVEPSATDATTSKESTKGQPKSGSVAGGKSATKRGPRKSAQPAVASLFDTESEQTEPVNSAGNKAIADVEVATEDIAAGEAVVQAAVADIEPEVEPEVTPESESVAPVKRQPQPLSVLTGDSFTITPDVVEKIRSGGAVTKYKQNMDAIHTMNQIVLEGRRATFEEQETMALYAGWGGIKDLFAATGNNYAERKKWFDRQEELKRLIGEEAYKEASASTKNAHYTDPRIVQSMWEMARRLGFTKGRMLEPSMGSGNFFGLIPADLRGKTALTGVELDNTTGTIAKLLYPDANISVQGFEDFKAPDGFFDLAMGNVPFGEYRISDTRYNKLLPLVHNYFFLKALDKVRPGGLVMFISSTGTMDSSRAEGVRKELYKQADLVSAIRFPAETFGKTALTSVVTDLVILRKRMPGEEAGSDLWLKSSEVDDPRGTGYPKVRVNDWLAANRSQMLGDFNGANRMYPGRANLDRTEDFEQRLAEAILALPEGVMTSPSRTPITSRTAIASAKTKDGAYVVQDGQLMQNRDGGLVPVEGSPDRIRRVEGMLAVRDAFDKLIDGEMGRTALGTSRKDLNSAYDKFNAKYGPISEKKNREALDGDPDLPRLMALEDWDSKKKVAKKAPIFTKSTVSGMLADAKPRNIQEAVVKSFQLRGEVIVPLMADDLGLTEELIGEELRAKKIAFQTPQGNWELAAHYLSGNVRRKLSEAKIAAASDSSYQANVDALEAIAPRDIEHTQISVEMGAPWMSPSVISQFVGEMFNDNPANIQVNYDRHLGLFTVSLDRSPANYSSLATTTWGTEDVPFKDILNLALSGKSAKVSDSVKNADGSTSSIFNPKKTQAANTKLDAVKKRFREWIWENEDRRKKLTDKYNDLFNSHVPAEYNVDFMLDEDGGGTVPGLASGWKLRRHQLAAVFRGVIEKRGLLAHEVGLGKTLAMIATASELKRLGIARKPAISVPKKVLPAFAATVRAAFPLLKLHVVDSRDAAKRNVTMSQIATTDFDLVLMTHDNMDMLKMEPEFEAQMLQQELDEVNAVYDAIRAEKRASGQSGADKRILKQIENRRVKLAAKINDALKSERKDDAITFENTGIDFLFVDEFHKYKSLPVVTALGQVKGVPTGDSQRAVNMLMRARYLQQIQKGGGLIGATGTPVSNSLVEAWIMGKFLQPDLLEEAGVESFDAWVRQFAETVPALEMGATGEWKSVSRLSKFRNLPELQVMSRMTLDVKTAKETGILDVRPKRRDTVIEVPQTEAQAAYMQVLRERANAVKSRAVEPWQDNYLVISSDGMLMASDPRLVLPGYTEKGGKVKALVDNVLRILKEKPGNAQMIFSDSGVSSNAWGFHLYGEIINDLVAGGIPRDKIIDFSKLDSDKKVETATARLNSGDALIAIGHRENMGTGVNAQERMSAIHQFDVPWKPSLVEQSEARGWRQGNTNKEIDIVSYVTSGSFDAVKWSTVARKQQAISAFMQKPNDNASRELEDSDDDALSYDQIAAAASGDGDYLRKAELDAKVFKLSMMEQSHNSDALARRQEIPRIKDRIAALQRRALQFDKMNEVAKPIKEKPFSFVSRDNNLIENKADAAKQLVMDFVVATKTGGQQPLGYYKGLKLEYTAWGPQLALPVPGQEPEYVRFNVNTEEYIGTFSSIEKKIAGLASDADATHIRETIVPGLERDLEQLSAVTESPFPYSKELARARAQQEAVSKRLAAKEADSAAEGEPLHAGEGTDVRAVSALGREVRRKLREKEIKPSDIPGILEKRLAEIQEKAKFEADVWKEFQRRKAEDFLLDHDNDTGLAGLAITARSASQAQAAYDPEIDAPLGPMAARRNRQDVEGSPEFQKWFAGSKVVDKDGKPVPVYHGTQSPVEISEVKPEKFDPDGLYGPGFYTTQSPDVAAGESGYAMTKGHRENVPVEGKPHAYKLYLRIEKPFDIDKQFSSAAVADIIAKTTKVFTSEEMVEPMSGQQVYRYLTERFKSKKKANQALGNLGFDGITHLGGKLQGSAQSFGFARLRAEAYAKEVGGTVSRDPDTGEYQVADHRVWIAFEPNQVKSFFNRGTFDDSADLSTARRQVAGPAADLANPMDVLLHQQSILKTRGNRGARLYVNDHARALLGASLSEVFGDDYSNVASINLSRKEVGQIVDYLEVEAKVLSGEYQAGALDFVDSLRQMLAASATQKTFTIVDITPYEQRKDTGLSSDRERAVETVKGDIREERFHWSQREIGDTAIASVGASWAQSSKGFGKYRKALIKLGYPDNPEILAAETAAKIAAGKFEDLDIRTDADHEQAQNWLVSYFERIADKHGLDALTKFDQLLPKAAEAKTQGAINAKDRIREAIAKEKADRERADNGPRAPGSRGESVSSAKGTGGQSDGKDEIPRRSADEPFESVPQVKGPQLPINEKANVENVRQVSEKAPDFESVKGARVQPKLIDEGSPSDEWPTPFLKAVKQESLFDEKTMKPKKDWEWTWATLGDILNLPKALRASGDLSAGGRQGWFTSIPFSRWPIAIKSFKRGVQASEAFGFSKGAYDRLHKELTSNQAYKAMVSAGWVPLTSDEGKLTAETEMFGSRLAGALPWVKYSEQSYKMNLDWLAVSTFEIYKKGIDKTTKDLRERQEGYEAAVDWINVSLGRGSYRGKFGHWYKEKAAPFLNVIGWAPGLVYSRIQMLNPVTYAKNVKSPQHRAVFRKQMSELFQSAAVLFLTGALAKAGGALISTDPDEADFLKLRFGTTRYDVLAGLQQVARLGVKLGKFLHIKATVGDDTEAGAKELRKSGRDTTAALLRFGRTKVGPVAGLIIDWMNDWTKVTGERHAPGEFYGSFKEGQIVKGFADLVEDPLVSQVIPLFAADMVAAFEQGWRTGGKKEGLTHAAKMLPAGFGIGVQDYDRPEWSKKTAKNLDDFDLDPKFPARKYGEKETEYQARVKKNIAEKEKAIDTFVSDSNIANQPMARKKIILQQEMSEDGRERLQKLHPEDIESDRMVRTWILVGLDRMKKDPVYLAMPEYEQKKAVQSYYGRMSKYKAQPANKQHGYQAPDVVTENTLRKKIKEAIESREGN